MCEFAKRDVGGTRLYGWLLGNRFGGQSYRRVAETNDKISSQSSTRRASFVISVAADVSVVSRVSLADLIDVQIFDTLRGVRALVHLLQRRYASHDDRE